MRDTHRATWGLGETGAANRVANMDLFARQPLVLFEETLRPATGS